MEQYEVFGRQVFSLSKTILGNAVKHTHSDVMDRLKKFKILQNYQPESLAVDKFKIPPSGDVHDYYSQGAFWFPDESKPDGLPYINKDGLINPDADDPQCDRNRRKRMFTNIYSLAVIYFFTGNESFADKAIELLRRWFLLPETKMNPNVNFGQAIPGIRDGRGAGIIEFHFLIQVVDAILMISSSKHWDEADEKGIKQWMADFLEWLRTSEIGIEESQAPSNHGTWYTAMSMKLASYCGFEELIHEYSGKIRERVKKQIMPDGSQPVELKRTQPWHYSIFGINGFLAAATIALEHNEDLFNYQTESGAGIKKAVDFLAAYASGEKVWSYPELYAGEYGKADFAYNIPEKRNEDAYEKFRCCPKTWPCPELYGFLPEKLSPALHIAAFYYRDERYREILEQIPPYDDAAGRFFFSGTK